MVAIALDGELVASELKATLTQRISELEKSAVTPGLGTILLAKTVHQKLHSDETPRL